MALDFIGELLGFPNKQACRKTITCNSTDELKVVLKS